MPPFNDKEAEIIEELRPAEREGKPEDQAAAAILSRSAEARAPFEAVLQPVQAAGLPAQPGVKACFPVGKGRFFKYVDEPFGLKVQICYPGVQPLSLKREVQGAASLDMAAVFAVK